MKLLLSLVGPAERAAGSCRSYVTVANVTSRAWHLRYRDSFPFLPKRWSSGDGTKRKEEGSKLPKPPVPDLQKTLKTYLDYAEVLRNPEQMKYTRNIVDDFLEYQGPKLQQLLLERQKNMDNWVTPWWLDDMYLRVRTPLPINLNASQVYPRWNTLPQVRDMLDMGALFVAEALNYKDVLDRGELPVERATSLEKGQPLCMELYYRVFGMTRVPEIGKDRIVTPERHDQQEEMIVVMRKNHFYEVKLKDADGNRLNAAEIRTQLLACVEDAAAAPLAPKVGLLTTMERDLWARKRHDLLKYETNRETVNIIDRSLFLLILDEDIGTRSADPEVADVERGMHGNGTSYCSANRWFDKFMQLILSPTGSVNICLEHSVAEGIPMHMVMHAVIDKINPAQLAAPSNSILPAPRRLPWKLTPDLEHTIETAGRELDIAIDNVDLTLFLFNDFSRDFMKKCNTSPDVFIQLAIQLACYKMYGHLVSTYESAGLRRFQSGRADSIRSAHGAAFAWVKEMGSETVFGAEKKQKLRHLFAKAAEQQTSVLRDTILGHGIDNHLLGLREAARESTGDIPDLFKDPTYKEMYAFRMSTSQIPKTIEGSFGCYGAVVPDGHGCCYHPEGPDSVRFAMTGFKGCGAPSTATFQLALSEAFAQMKSLFS